MVFNGSFILHFPFMEELWTSKKPPTAGGLRHPHLFRGMTDKRSAHGGLAAVYPIFNHAHCVKRREFRLLTIFYPKKPIFVRTNQFTHPKYILVKLHQKVSEKVA